MEIVTSCYYLSRKIYYVICRRITKTKNKCSHVKRDLAAILQFIIYIRDSCNGIPTILPCVYVCGCVCARIAVLFSVQRLLCWIMCFKWVRVSDPWRIKKPFSFCTWREVREIRRAFSRVGRKCGSVFMEWEKCNEK